MHRAEIASHPLDPTSETEVHTVKRILESEGLLGESVRSAFLGLEESDKAEVGHDSCLKP